ncbi:MAG: phasin family protein [Pikeienuella sp.]
MAAAKTAAKKVETLVEDTQKVANEQIEKVTKSFEDITVFGQDNVDALVKSSSIAVKAAEGLNAEIVSFSKKSLEEGVAAAKELASIKTLPELVEKQADFAKTSFDGFMKQATRFNEMYMAAAKEVFEPLNARATVATDMVKSYTA